MFLKVPGGFQWKFFSSCPDTLLLPINEPLKGQYQTIQGNPREFKEIYLKKALLRLTEDFCASLNLVINWVLKLIVLGSVLFIYDMRSPFMVELFHHI